MLLLVGCAARDQKLFPRSPRGLEGLRLWDARVIYVAETHNKPAHHKLQEHIIRSLHRGGHPIAVGMEMIDVTQQRALDRYLEKKISWTVFAWSTSFESGWGKTSPAYKRILEWCRRKEIPVVGLNAPRSITRKIASKQELTVDEEALIPKFREPPGGFEKFRTNMAGHPGSGSVRRYYEAQRAWDTTMAKSILLWLRKHEGTLVVLLGQVHADPQTGVPWYVAKKAHVMQVVVYPKE